jgi:hypothetical protein
MITPVSIALPMKEILPLTGAIAGPPEHAGIKIEKNRIKFTKRITQVLN